MNFGPLLGALALASVLLPVSATASSASRPAPQTAQTTVSAVRLPLVVREARVMAVPPTATETSAGMVLRNLGSKPIVLTAFRSDVAARNELMTMHHDAQGRMGMVTVKSLTVPARGELVLKPGGDHLMLMGLKRPLRVGERLTLTLVTADGQTLTVRAPVQKP
ncbi:copper chaperone PCu(A)C [Deinococcus murrayi]|uniref:copper chaperone PCu(A)C n=1 Tax=Deinococcus murrayi TaxID=68910 RepID=UPI0004802986|nr:copper chaperone PCu(A)C [Deinococcus murrayi]